MCPFFVFKIKYLWLYNKILCHTSIIIMPYCYSLFVKLFFADLHSHTAPYSVFVVNQVYYNYNNVGLVYFI
jgi:hypothetical protein